MNYEPLKMHPCYKEYLWGGNRLKTGFFKTDAPEITAESWELADHEAGVSVVEGGELAGLTVSDLMRLDRRGFLGERWRGEKFPILVKLIDAARDLSIQVHPSDKTALRELGEQGKAEMWCVVDCEPKSALYYGFSQKISREEFLQRATDGTICEVLNRVPVQKGDVFYILPGTIHAIGSGILVAEIQQNSNTTFRVYDYQRRDAQGNLRPLHLERAMAVVDLEPVVPAECRANSGAVFPEFSMAKMFSCPYFRAYRLDLRSQAELCCDGQSFQHLLCIEGEGEIEHEGKAFPFRRGDSYFMPAALGDYRIKGKSSFLLSCI